MGPQLAKIHEWKPNREPGRRGSAHAAENRATRNREHRWNKRQQRTNDQDGKFKHLSPGCLLPDPAHEHEHRGRRKQRPKYDFVCRHVGLRNRVCPLAIDRLPSAELLFSTAG